MRGGSYNEPFIWNLKLLKLLPMKKHLDEIANSATNQFIHLKHLGMELLANLFSLSVQRKKLIVYWRGLFVCPSSYIIENWPFQEKFEFKYSTHFD